jgi:hypothetical protein
VQLAIGGFIFFWGDMGGLDHSFPLCIGCWGSVAGKVEVCVSAKFIFLDNCWLLL